MERSQLVRKGNLGTMVAYQFGFLLAIAAVAGALLGSTLIHILVTSLVTVVVGNYLLNRWLKGWLATQQDEWGLEKLGDRLVNVSCYLYSPIGWLLALALAVVLSFTPALVAVIVGTIYVTSMTLLYSAGDSLERTAKARAYHFGPRTRSNGHH